MSVAITDRTHCIVMRSGAELWISEDRARAIEDTLTSSVRFLRVDDDIVNVAEIVGIYSAKTMANVSRRMNGEWKDQDGKWRRKGERTCRCGNAVPIGLRCGNCSSY